MAIHEVPVDPGARGFRGLEEVRDDVIRMGGFDAPESFRNADGGCAKGCGFEDVTPTNLTVHGIFAFCVIYVLDKFVI
jgi:hypothetical protein